MIVNTTLILGKLREKLIDDENEGLDRMHAHMSNALKTKHSVYLDDIMALNRVNNLSREFEQS